ncbi:MAG: type II toxin-antitoxin system RelE/ParE family toxin [Patescibacteria group bacterium]
MNVSFFEAEAKKSPVEKFIKSQNPKVADKIARVIDLLEEFGPKLYLHGSYTEKITDKIHALTVRGSIQIRVFYCFYRNSAVLLHAFTKKTNKIPPKEIKIAQTRFDSLTT